MTSHFLLQQEHPPLQPIHFPAFLLLYIKRTEAANAANTIIKIIQSAILIITSHSIFVSSISLLFSNFAAFYKTEMKIKILLIYICRHFTDIYRMAFL